MYDFLVILFIFLKKAGKLLSSGFFIDSAEVGSKALNKALAFCRNKASLARPKRP